MTKAQKEKTKKSENAIATAVSTKGDAKQEFLEKLKKKAGLVELALNELNIDKSTYKEWCKDVSFSMKLAEVNDYAGDLVEGMLLKKMQEGDTQAIIFYCETKLRGRGYYKKS